MNPLAVIIISTIITAIVFGGALYSLTDEYKELQRKKKQNKQ